MTEQFTEAEQIKLKAARAIVAEVKAARRERAGEVSKQAQKAEEQRLRAEAEKKRLADAKARLEAKEIEDKADYDKRIRKVLLDLTYAMKDQQVRLLVDQYQMFARYYGPESKRTKVFTMHDSKGLKARPTDIYWVYGKGFEWE